MVTVADTPTTLTAVPLEERTDNLSREDFGSDLRPAFSRELVADASGGGAEVSPTSGQVTSEPSTDTLDDPPGTLGTEPAPTSQPVSTSPGRPRPSSSPTAPSSSADTERDAPPPPPSPASQQELSGALNDLRAPQPNVLPDRIESPTVTPTVTASSDRYLGDFVVANEGPDAVLDIRAYYGATQYDTAALEQVSDNLDRFATVLGVTGSLVTRDGFRLGVYAEVENSGDAVGTTLNGLRAGIQVSFDFGSSNDAAPANSANQILTAVRNENERIREELESNLATYRDDPPMYFLALQTAAEQYSMVSKRSLELLDASGGLDSGSFALVQDDLTANLRSVLGPANARLIAASPEEQQILASFFAGTPLAPMLAVGNPSNPVTATSLSGRDPALASQQILGSFMERAGITVPQN